METGQKTTRNVQTECKHCREMIRLLHDSLERLNADLNNATALPPSDISHDLLPKMLRISNLTLTIIHSLQNLLNTLTRHATKTQLERTTEG